MRVLFVEGPGSPSEHIAVVDDDGIVIDGRGDCPLDDLRGIVVVGITEDERARLIEHGFDLPTEQ